MMLSGFLPISERRMDAFAAEPTFGAVVQEARQVAKERPGEWIVCQQILTFREWARAFLGLAVTPREPQLAILWFPREHHWHVALAGLMEGLPGRFVPREHRLRFPRIIVDYYFR